MQVISKFEAILINARVAGEGKNGKYYNVSVEQNDASCELSCNKEVFDTVKAGTVPKYSNTVFFAEYNTQYGSFRVVDIVPFAEEKKK